MMKRTLGFSAEMTIPASEHEQRSETRSNRCIVPTSPSLQWFVKSGGVRVEPPDYSGGTPTDPDEWISLIRFLRIRFR